MKKIVIIPVLIILCGLYVYSERSSDIDILISLQSRNYNQAKDLIIQNLPTLSNKAYYKYLLGMAYLNLKDYKKAREVYEGLIKDYPSSGWSLKSKYKIAFIQYKEKKYKQAYETYKSMLSLISSKERRSKFSKMYSWLGNKYAFNKDKTKRNYSYGTTYFKRAIEIGEGSTEDEELLYYNLAKAYFEWRSYYNAERWLKKFIKKYKNSKLSDKALTLLGEIYYKRGRYNDARKCFLAVIEKYSASKLAAKAAYLAGKSYRPSYSRSEISFFQGIKYLNLAFKKYKDKKYSPLAGYEIGMLYSRKQKHLSEAIDTFLDFEKKYPSDKKSAEAIYNAARLYLQLKDYSRAVFQLKRFLEKHSNNRLWRSVRSMISLADFSRALDLYNAKNYTAAYNALDGFVSKYPLNHQVYRALFLKADIRFKKKEYTKAVKEYEELFEKNSSNSFAVAGIFKASEIYIKNLENFEKGIKVLEKIKSYSHRRVAEQKIKELKSPLLKLKVKKHFLSTVEPVINVTSRNIEELKINVYKINLLDYFYKYNSLKGVENLDILLISPDKTFIKKIENYKKIKNYENKIKLFGITSGGYVIQIVSKTKTATALLIKGDVALSVIASKNELLLHAKNLATKSAEGNCEVFISDGSKIILKAKTDARGFYLKELKKLYEAEGIDPGRLSILIKKGESFSWTDLNMSGISSQTGASNRIYVFQNKPFYKPGDTLSFKAVIREVKSANLSIPDDKKFRVRLFSPSGNLIYDKEEVLSEYGSISSDIHLDSALDTGSLRLSLISSEGKISYTKYINVSNYMIPKNVVEITKDKDLYIPGDKVKLKIKVLNLALLPYKNMRVRVRSQLTDEESLTTDKNGIINYILDTSKAQDRKSIWFRVMLTDGSYKSINIKFGVYTAKIKIKMPKRMFIEEENIRVKINTVDLKNKKISAAGIIKLIKTQNSAEIEVLRKPFTTVNGSVNILLGKISGGTYKLEASLTGTGFKAKNNLSYIKVSKKDDKTHKIFILNDTTKADAGKNYTLKLFSRLVSQDKGVLVITSEKIHYFTEVIINPGINNIKLALAPNYFPKVKIRVGLSTIEGSYSSYLNLKVGKKLNLKLTGVNRIYAPKSNVVLGISAFNNKNQAVNADVAIAVINSELLKRHNITTEDIRKYFKTKPNLNLFRYKASLPFSYNGITKNRSREVLAENSLRIAEADRINNQNRPDNFLARAAAGAAAPAASPIAQSSTSPNQPYDGRRYGYRRSRGLFAAERRMRADDEGESSRNEGAATGGMSGSQIRELFKESAYFNPSVKVISKAQVKFKLPDNIAKWKVIVIGLSKESTFCIKQANILTKKKVFVSLSTPEELTQGDSIRASAGVYNSLRVPVNSAYNIALRQGSEERSSGGNVSVAPGSDRLILSNARFVIKNISDAVFSASASGDSERLRVPVRAWARYKTKGVSGFTNRSIIRNIEIPSGYLKKELVINIYPHSLRFLQTIGNKTSFFRRYFTSKAASELIKEVSYYNVIKASSGENSTELKEIKERIKQRILNSYNYIAYSGSYRWIRTRPVPDNNTSILMFYALSYAKKSGFKLNKVYMARTSNYLMGIYKFSNDSDKKAAILWALSSYKSVDFSYLNRLYRLKSSLSPSGLSFLAMAFINEGRKAMADNIISILLSKRNGILWGNENNTDGKGFLTRKADISAAVLCAISFDGKHPGVVKSTLKRLIEEIEGINNPSNYFAAFFSQAFSNYLIKYQREHPTYTVSFKVNGKEVLTKRVSAVTGIVSAKVSPSLLKDKNKIEIAITGEANLSYSAYISYYKPGEVFANIKRYGKIKKTYYYPDFVFEGKKIARGNRVSEATDSYVKVKHQVLKKVSRGKIFKANLEIKLRRYKETYFILKDYIPSGAKLSEGSVKGDFVYYTRNKNELTFYLKKSRYTRTFRITYELLAVYEGLFKTLPCVFHPVDNASKEVSGNVATIEIENESFNTFEDYQFTPDELYFTAELLYKKKDFSKAHEYLKKLTDKYNLRDYFFKKAAEMMLYISIKNKSHSEVVKYFDILRERNPDLNLKLADIKKIAKSYSEIGEHERAMLLSRDLMEAYFSQESQLGAVFLKAKLLDKSISVMNDIFRSYPDTDNVKAVYYGFGQELYNYFSSLSPVSKKGRKGYGIYKKARDIFINFLSEYPDYKNGDEVSFTFLNLLLDKKRYTDLYNASVLFAKRYPQSRYLADYKYLSAYSLYELGKFKEALKYAKDVAYNKFPVSSSSGRMEYSKNKDFATHMLAKIYHALGNMEEALKEYRKVASKFADAKHSLEFLKRKNITFPEVSRFSSNEEVSVKINTKGIKEFELKVYKVDFVILCLSRNNLSDMRNVNLAGIKPLFFKKIKINSNEDDITASKVVIPVSGKGAYLAVIKSNELETSGIVLLSDIRADVQAYGEGRVRALIRDKSGKRLSGVKMYYRGTSMRKTVRGESDARGISEGNEVSGIPIVFGEYKGNYIFYRGNFKIGASNVPAFQSQPAYPSRYRKLDALRNILNKRRAIQEQQQRIFKQNTTRNIRQYRLRDLMH